MRVTIKYSMAVEEGMRRFFFSLLSSLCLRQPPRDPEPGGLAAGRAQRRRRHRARARIRPRTRPRPRPRRGPGPAPVRPEPAAAARLPPPRPAPRSAPAPRRPPGLGGCRSHTRSRARTEARARSRSARARRGGGRVLRGSATCSPALREVAARRRPPACCPPAAAAPPVAAPLAPGTGAGGGRGAEPGVARLGGAVPRRRPRSGAGLRRVCARVTPPAAPGGGGGQGGAVCVRTQGGSPHRPARPHEHGGAARPPRFPACTRGCPSRSSGSPCVRGGTPACGEGTEGYPLPPLRLGVCAEGHRARRCSRGGVRTGVPLLPLLRGGGARSSEGFCAVRWGCSYRATQSRRSSASPSPSRERFTCAAVGRRKGTGSPICSVLLFLGLCPAAWPLPPPVLPVAGLLLPGTKFLAGVGRKQVLSEGVAHRGGRRGGALPRAARPRERPAVAGKSRGRRAVGSEAG